MAYKKFGTPSSNTWQTDGNVGTPTEYNINGYFYHYRFNDCYIFSATMGTGQTGFFLFTPTIFRTPWLEGPFKTNYIDLYFQEDPANRYKYNGTTGLSSKGITFYYKVASETNPALNTSAGLAENTSIPYIGVTMIGVGEDGGGSRVGLTLEPAGNQGTAFCFGFETSGGSGQGITGTYTYYLVNSYFGNTKEIVWRMQFNFGTTFSANGTPLARNTYVVTNPNTNDTTVGSFIASDGVSRFYKFVGSTADDCHIPYLYTSPDPLTEPDLRPYQIYPVKYY